MEDSILNIINDVGFPIAVSIALYYRVSKTDEMYLKLFREFQDVINNNTKSIELLNNSVQSLKRDMSYKAGEDL